MKVKKIGLFSVVLFSFFCIVFSASCVLSVRGSSPAEEIASTLTLETSTQDAYIESAGAADQNEGASFDLYFGFDPSGPTVLRVLVQFALPPELSGVNVTAATLKLWGPWRWSGGSLSGDVLRACRVTHKWVEGTGDGGFIQDGVTWNEYNYSDGLSTATNNWATLGGDYTLADSSTFTFPDTLS